MCQTRTRSFSATRNQTCGQIPTHSGPCSTRNSRLQFLTAHTTLQTMAGQWSWVRARVSPRSALPHTRQSIPAALATKPLLDRSTMRVITLDPTVLTRPDLSRSSMTWSGKLGRLPSIMCKSTYGDAGLTNCWCRRNMMVVHVSPFGANRYLVS